MKKKGTFKSASSRQSIQVVDLSIEQVEKWGRELRQVQEVATHVAPRIR